MVTQVTKTLDDLVSEVRQIINDKQTPYRYSDAWVIAKINSALRQLYRLRPDAYIGNFTTGVLSSNVMNTYSPLDLQTAAVPPVPATPLPVDDRLFFSPLLFYVVGILEVADDEFADDNRAMMFLQAFKTALIGVGG